MKKIMLLLLMYVTMGNVLNAQQTTYKLDQNGVRVDKESLLVEKGTLIKVVVTNVNPYKLTGASNITSNPLVFDIPTNLTLQFPTNTSKVDEAEKTDVPKDGLTEKLKELSIGKQVFNKKIRLSEKGFLLDEVLNTDLVDSLQKLNAELRKKLAAIRKEDSIKNNFALHYNDAIGYLHKMYAYQSITKYIDSINNSTLFIQNTAHFKENLKNYLQLILQKGKSETATTDLISAFNESITGFHHAYIEMVKSYTALNNELDSAKIPFDITITNKENKENAKTSLLVSVERKKIFETEFNAITKFYTKLNDPVYTATLKNNLNDGLIMYNNLLRSNFEITIPLKTETSPITTDVVTIEPMIKNYKGEVLKTLPSFNVSTYGCWKVNLSAGYLISFINEDNFSARTDAAGNNVGITKVNSNFSSHALGTLLHAYRTSKTDFNWGGCFGFGLPVNNQDLSLYLGVSFLLNEAKSRWILSLGCSLNKVQKLNNSNLKEGTFDFSASTSTQKTPLYDKVYQPSPFLSLTFNLAGSK